MTRTEFEQAIHVFIHGFAFTRSFTHPYLVETLTNQVSLLHDAPRMCGDYRTEEVIAAGIAVPELVALAQEKSQRRFRICYLLPTGEPDQELRTAFKASGYRLMATEELMVHRLADLTPPSIPYPLVRVTTEAESEQLAKAARRRQILPEHLIAKPPPMRQYMVLAEGKPVGWVGSVVVGERTWCTSMYVEPGYRRQGIARALLTRMLTDDRESGAVANILLASHTGSKLYPTVGYESLGMLYMFTPPKS